MTYAEFAPIAQQTDISLATDLFPYIVAGFVIAGLLATAIFWIVVLWTREKPSRTLKDYETEERRG